MDMIAQFITPGIAFLLTLAFGFWVSHLGKPYNGVLFNIHKLLALGAVVVTIIQLAKMLTTADSMALIIVLLVLAGVCVVALFATGALMSMGKLDYALMLSIHRIAPMVVALAMALVVYLLGKKP